MTKDEDFKLLKIQTHVLKVNIDCDGCKLKVKKLLQRIEGVFLVSIDVEHQKVQVTGNVESETLIRKLGRAGKHSELWSQKSTNQDQHKPNQQKQQKQAIQTIKDGNKNKKEQGKQGLMEGLKVFKSQHNKPPPLTSDEEDFDDDYDDEEEEDDDELRFLDNKMKQLNILRQPNNAANNGKKNSSGNGNVGGNGNNGAGKKGGGNQNQMKNPSGSDQKGINVAANSKMPNAAVAHLGVGNPSAGDGKRVNGINGMMGLHGHGGGNGGGLQINAFPGYTGFPSNAGGYAAGQQQQPQQPMMMNMHGYQTHPSTMMNNNLRGLSSNMMMHDSRYMQPQMMYHKSPQVTPYTGYYPCYPSPYYNNHQPGIGDYGAHLFSDENTNNCVVM